jgi:hypothetical protein
VTRSRAAPAGLRVEQSSLFARVAKVLLLPFVFLTEGLCGGASDARDVVTTDLRSHGMEVPAATGLPMSAGDESVEGHRHVEHR